MTSESEPGIYVADAHSLVWFIAGDARLSKAVEHLLERAELAEIQVLVPTIVLAEMTYIAHKKKAAITIEEVVQRIEQGDGFTIVPFDATIFRVMLQFPEEREIHDRIIAATAAYYQATVITKDEVLRNAQQIKTIW